MKLKQMTIWIAKNGLVSIGVYLIAMAVLYSAFSIALASGNDHVTVNGMGVSLYVMLLILGIVHFAQNLRFGLANGVSRRSVYLGFMLFLVPTTVAAVLVSEVLLLLVSLISHDMSDLLYYLFDGYIGSRGAFAGHLAVLVCSTAFGLFFGTLGYLIGAAFYRLGRVGRYTMGIGLPVFLFGVLPLVFAVLPDAWTFRLLEALASVGRFLIASPYRLALPLFVAAAGMALLSWLLIRRAPLKTA